MWIHWPGNPSLERRNAWQSSLGVQGGSHQEHTLLPHPAKRYLDGDYTVKPSYQFLLTNHHNAEPGSNTMKPLWKAIWQLQVPSKVKNLVWRVCKDSLPSKKNLVKRRIITDDKCDQCKTMIEDIHHALYLCPMLQELWQSIPLWNHQSLKQCGNFVDLLECIFADNRDPTLFSMVAWNLWNRRNNLSLAKGMVSLGQLL